MLCCSARSQSGWYHANAIEHIDTVPMELLFLLCSEQTASTSSWPSTEMSVEMRPAGKVDSSETVNQMYAQRHIHCGEPSYDVPMRAVCRKATGEGVRHSSRRGTVPKRQDGLNWTCMNV